MSRLEIRVLGPLSLRLNGNQVDTSRHKAVALLVYLAMTSERHRRGALAGLFWPDYEQAKAYAYLRRALWEIKEVLGEGWMDADRETIGLVRDVKIWIDARDFREESATTAGHDHAPAAVCVACIQPLSRAAELYRGDFLHGFSLRDSPGFDDWQFYEGEGLRQEAGDVLRKLSAIHGREREFDTAIDFARRWLALDPLNEEAHRQTMLLLALNGQRSAALRQYHECARLLESEMGIPPERKTTELFQQIQQGRIPAIQPESGLAIIPDSGQDSSLSKPQPRPAHHNLPRLLTQFIGRDRELSELDSLLADPDVCLLTILAVGGMGKTRLAIETAARQFERFEHGVVFVYMASLQAATGLIPALLEALELPPREGSPQKAQLLDYLCEKRVLLVMDNFEHLLDGADLVSEILRAAPGVKVLATSRLPLSLQGEHRYHLAGMDFPTSDRPDDAPDTAAVKLFVQGARRAAPGFRLENDSLQHVVAICRMVEGMPLGILLAAGWVELMPADEIASHMRGQRDFLETGMQDIPERQRSMSLVLQHAWGLLNDQERQAFERLSVFRGSFDTRAAQEVSGASLRVLMSLVNKSLLTRLANDRLAVHELLRQFAAQRLSEDMAAFEEAHDRHSALYCRRLGDWVQVAKNPGQHQATTAPPVDIDNTRVAWTWAALDRQVERLAAAAEGMSLLFWRESNSEEGEAAFRLAADSLGVPDNDEERILLSTLLAWQAMFASQRLASPDEVARLVEASFAWLDSSAAGGPAWVQARALALLVRGQVAQCALDPASADAAQEESLALYQQIGDRWWEATLLEQLGTSAWARNDLDSTASYLQRSLAVRQEIGDKMGTASVLIYLGALAGFDGGRVDDAEAMYREASRLFAVFADRASQMASLDALRAAENLQGRFAEALDLSQRLIDLATELGAKGELANFRMVLGETLQLMGNYAQALAEHRKNIADLHDTGWTSPETWARWAFAATLLGLGDYEEARRMVQPNIAVLEQSQGLSMLARTLAAISRADLGLGERDLAWAHARRAVELLSGRHYFWLLEAMAAVAAVLADRGEAERAVEIYALVNRHPYVANSRWFSEVFGSLVDKAAAGLAPEVRSAAQSRGMALDLWQAAREVVDS